MIDCSFSANSVTLQCTDEQNAIIQKELVQARVMAGFAGPKMSAENRYVKAFWPSDMPADWPADLAKTFGRVSALPDKTTTAYALTITCDGTLPDCTNNNKRVNAFITASTKTMNLCDPFWKIPSTQSRIDQCETGKRHNVALGAYRSQAKTLFHEIVHTTYVFDDDGDINIGDVVYGPDDCFKLAHGELENDGKYPVEAINNADSYVWTGLGDYWSGRCKYDVPAVKEASEFDTDYACEDDTFVDN